MLYFRADMNQYIATGHIMRCLAIADAAKMLGEDVTFISADESAKELVQKRGYRSIVLESPWDDMEAELPKLLNIIEREKIRSILIDSYYVTKQYLMELKKHVYIMYLDDVNAFHYPVHGLICYANYYKKFQYEERYLNETLLLGTKYVPLRQEFAECPPKIIGNVENVLLLTGGTDEYEMIPKILESLVVCPLKNIYVICGVYNRHYEKLLKAYSDNLSVHIMKSVDNMKDYMEKADIAITAAGSTLYELCAVGTPAISVTIADNQIPNAMQFQEDGVISYAGDARTDDIAAEAVKLLIELSASKERRKEISQKMQQIVDGKGALRIAEALLGV